MVDAGEEFLKYIKEYEDKERNLYFYFTLGNIFLSLSAPSVISSIRINFDKWE